MRCVKPLLGKGYKYGILQIIEVASESEHYLCAWLTESTRLSWLELKQELSNLDRKAKSKRKNEWLLQKLRDCHSSPILQVENCTAADFMDWLQSVRDKNKEGNNFLDKSSYGNRIAALRHLFRCHLDLEGFPKSFADELRSLKKGFFRILTTQNQDEGNGSSLHEGKKPMSYKLYQKCCEWFLKLGDLQGIFCHCFLC